MLISLLYSFLLALHPVHLSVTEIQHSEKDKALQITSRIFIDDLELSIRNKLKQPELDIMNPKNGMTTDQLAGNYLNEHLNILIDGKLQKTNLLGHETEGFAIIFYIEVANVKKFKTLEVLNSVIMETYEDQSNLVHVTYKGPVKSVRLVRDKPSEIFRFGDK